MVPALLGFKRANRSRFAPAQRTHLAAGRLQGPAGGDRQAVACSNATTLRDALLNSTPTK